MTWKTGIATMSLAGTAAVAAYAFGGATKTTQVNGVAWRNSLADAQTEARRTGKPILLLSMFGKIDEPMPCANARTLRATLFKDPEFRAFVEKEAIPVWEMVRPVPRVTIDFGNGKQLVRTVRGNAVMYLVSPEGKVFDAFPGVYTKADFLPAVRESIAKLAKADAATVVAYHASQAKPVPPTMITMGKGVVESPTLNLIGARAIRGVPVDLRTAGNDPKKREFLMEAARLSDLSLNPMPLPEVVARTTTGSETPEAIPASVLERDSATNMARTRMVVHYYFAAEKSLPTPAEARDAVLGTILKIPYKDPTMGLSDVLMPGTPE